MTDQQSDNPRALVWGLLAVVVAVGAALRLWAIGAKSLWLDETATMELVARPFGDMLRAAAERDTHPPLYYSVLHVWMWGSGSGAWARALSAAVATATIGLVYALARRLLPRGPSLVAAALLAASAYQVYFAQEARHYVLSAFLVVLSWWLLAELLAGGRRRRWPLWLGLALTNAAALYTFYYTAFAIAAQLVVLLVLWREGGRKLLPAWCVWQVLPVVLFSFYVPVVWQRLTSLRRVVPPGRYTGLRLEDLATTGAQFACGFAAELAGGHGQAVRLGAAALALAALGCGLAGLGRLRRAAVVAGVWLLVPVAAVAFFPFKGHVYEPKHLIFGAPALALLPAVGLAALRGSARLVPAAVVVVLLGANAWSLARYYDPRVEKENWRDAVSRVAQEGRDGDVLVLNPRYVYLPFRYYYQPERQRRPCPRLVVRETRPSGEPFRGRLASGRRVWVLRCASNVSVPNPRVAEALAERPVRLRERYSDLAGVIDLTLYDAERPPGGTPTDDRP